MNASELLAGRRIVPVVVISDAGQAVPLAETLLEAGLDTIEVTLRSAAALEAIRNVTEALPDVLVGAGSIRHPAQIREIESAGAAFAVSPGSSVALLEAVAASGIPFIPGVATASEVLEMLDRGYTLQKFFPAELAGGAPYLEAMAAPIPEARFMPTGGIDPDNAANYLSLPNVECIGGSWVAPTGLLQQGDFGKIAELAVGAVRLAV
jgi:2-dehydro-3-deoxyphosphogluconate aldolase/(4S)-4-hydroxy-2-oxoglutarate aldolase